jgi:hypothetical protein
MGLPEEQPRQPSVRRQPRKAALSDDIVEGVMLPVTSGERNYLWDTALTGFGAMVTHGGTRSYLIQ